MLNLPNLTKNKTAPMMVYLASANPTYCSNKARLNSFSINAGDFASILRFASNSYSCANKVDM